MDRNDVFGVNISNPNDAKKLIELLSHQTEYIDQLEKENGVIVAELQTFKCRLQNVVDENQAIHDDLQGGIIEETLNKSNTVLEQSNSQPEFTQIAHSAQPQIHLSRTSPSKSNKESLEKWKTELAHIEAMYNSKMSGLEVQIKKMEQDLKHSVQENLELKKQIQTQNDCLNGDMKNEADKENLKDIQNKVKYGVNAPIIERLTKEKDELMKSTVSLRSALKDQQLQEVSLRREVQKSLSVLEDVQFQKTQIMIENDHLRNDLASTQKKLEIEIGEGQKRTLEGVAQQRLFCAKEIEGLNNKVGELMSACAQYESALENAGKEKQLLHQRLEESRAQLLQTEKDLATMRAEVKQEVQSALKGYSGAELELRETRNKLEQELIKTKQEHSRYEQEVLELRQRLTAAESHSLTIQELNVALTQQLNDANVKVNDQRIQLEKISKTNKTEVEKLKRTSSETISSLEYTLESSQFEYETRLSALEGISSRQSLLIQKLRKECKSLEDATDALAKKYRCNVGNLQQDNEQMSVRLKRLSTHNKELSQQCVKHGITHKAMKDLIAKLDARAQLSGGQVIELLDRQTQLARDKEVLNNEVQLLQSQVTPKIDLSS